MSEDPREILRELVEQYDNPSCTMEDWGAWDAALARARALLAVPAQPEANSEQALAELIAPVMDAWTIDSPRHDRAPREVARAVIRAGWAPAQPEGAETVTREEWATWHDADNPSDPKADIYGCEDEDDARERLCVDMSTEDDEHSDYPWGMCKRTVTTITGPWVEVPAVPEEASS